MQALSPVFTAPLFAPLHHQLIALLDKLEPRDWGRPTLAGSWRVRDVVAHLVDVDLRRLSAGRDRYQVEPRHSIDSYGDLVAFLNELNAEWVVTARRFSPHVLVDLLRESGAAMARMVSGLPPHAPAPFGVAWAGEQQSENWFDIGRDYTERWHHQMQIRDAVGAPGLLDPQWLLPLLDLSVRCLPRAYAGVQAPAGTTVMVRVRAVAANNDAEWTLQARTASGDEFHSPEQPSHRSIFQAGQPSASPPVHSSSRPSVHSSSSWRLWRGSSPSPAATIGLDADAAWRLFYNALPIESARQKANVEGDAALAEPLLRARAVMV